MGIVKLRIGWNGISLEAADGGGSGSDFDISTSVGTAGVEGVRKALLVWDRSVSSVAEDVATTHLDFLNLTGGAADDSWVNADFAAVEAGIATWWTAMRGDVHGSHTLREVRWYKIDGAGGAHPVIRTAAIGGAGTSANDPLPFQVALSVTLKTGIRKRWGRCYLPGFTEAQNRDNGRPDGTFQANVATRMATLLGSGKAQGLVPVVYSPTQRLVHSVRTVTVDDIWDVQRSRRMGRAAVRSSATPDYA